MTVWTNQSYIAVNFYKMHNELNKYGPDQVIESNATPTLGSMMQIVTIVYHNLL